MTEHAVVIAGGGPTGLMLAGELALAGIDVVIVERRANQDVDGSRSGGLHSRTIEVLDQRGIADRFLAEGQAMQIQGFVGIPLDISDFPTRHNYGLALWQSDFERILAAWVSELAVPIHREREVTGFAQDDTGVDVELADGQSLRADYLVGCDGGRSVVRKAAGIDFVGWDATTSWLIAEVEMDEEPQLGMRREGGGIGPVNRVEGGGPFRVVLTEQHVDHISEPTLQDLTEALIVAYGTDYGVHSPTWISRFTDMTRQAASYRHGRVLLAGDAAHVHPPQGGQGLNTGVQDAVNLGWKLAQVVNTTSPESLLDTYHAERHPVGARVLHNTMAQVALSGSDDRHQALRDTMTELLSMDEPRRRIAAMLSGLDVHYDLGQGHSLLGRRMPDLDLHTADGPTRVFTLLHDARPVLLNLGEPDGFDTSPWANRVRLVDARHDGVCELPVLGEVAAPPAVVIRPDGHVAWTGDLMDPELPRALATWFGAATPAHWNPPSERHRAHHLGAGA
ncbi:MAG TPA: FAD-dependent monooxygenase [Acidimicrobiales bacterium]|nr:FAD-dependent monooxygenase [Acidimicrobiales bacterium]